MEIECDSQWLATELKNKINTIDWEYARNDVRNFLSETDRRGLEVWSKEFFDTCVDKLLLESH